MIEVITDLSGALRRVARASFYEDIQVTPIGEDDRYRVEDTTANEQRDDWYWSYEKGIHDGDSVAEHSRLMEHYEHFNSSEHIRFNMSESVEALKKGKTVVFAYAIVTDLDVTWSNEDQVHYDSDGHPADDIAGWILTANHYETDTEQV